MHEDLFYYLKTYSARLFVEDMAFRGLITDIDVYAFIEVHLLDASLNILTHDSLLEYSLGDLTFPVAHLHIWRQHGISSYLQDASTNLGYRRNNICFVF